MSLRIELAGHALDLRGDRSVWWPEQRTAFVADVHLGKDQVFRRSGVPIPADVLHAELAALDAVLAGTGAERLVVLGDWVHAAPAGDDAWPHVVARWRERHAALELILVAGNHDRGLRPWLERWRMTEWGEGIEIDGLALMHEVDPADPPAGFSGHMHPVVRFGSRGDRVRLSAFARRDDHLILPAFGRFTGGGEGLERAGWSFYGIAGERVVDLSGARRRPRR
ncbi:ligase-associated DNA damage response endonuclease PdeM [Wenzhouxiangella sp. XN79A]|uniref:ligase-associated DNA damage response endonuclease PdeM n=1 Tax=Wenzhouxiangella sp. XN79A TaxID=2724193 RepID=UPI00144A7D5B|nr:ligase-associated DNA damage response endonuclease PdeM [Wenzhouxiangella sp. XN79A]NKI34625.1 ligase-associated DNA damage response endonuclease PdeM [Wenzhouxiangella sp. XN79A]